MQDLSFEVSLKGLREEGRPITPAALAGLLSTLLYSRRGSPFFVEPIIAGLDSGGKPYLCGQVRPCGEWGDGHILVGYDVEVVFGNRANYFARVRQQFFVV